MLFAILLFISISVLAGPVEDRIQTILNATKSTGVVPSPQRMAIIDAFVTSPRYAGQLPMVLVGEELEPQDPATMTSEARAQFTMDRIRDFLRRPVRKKAEAAEGVTQHANSKAAVKAAGDAAEVL